MAKNLERSFRAVAIDLFRELRKEDQGNIFFSPFSIQAAFSMFLAGSGGVTHEEISKVLHVMTKNPGDVHVQFRDLLKTIENHKDVTLATANKVFVQDGAKIQEEYLSRVKESYLSAVENTDFSDDTNRAKINAWVENQTKNKIKDLLPPGSLNAMTRIVLVNAIYFKGNWLNQFDPASTRNQPFFQTKKKTIDVPMMSRKGNYRLIDIDALNARILELPYKGESMSMFLLVPREVDGLEALENALTHEMLEKVISTKGARRELTVVLPKFKLESSFTLRKTLSKLGMPSAFNADEADFSGITGDKSLFVSEGYHKAFLEVNEEGSEAAAATRASGLGCAFGEIEEEVRVDRPFLFFIKDGPLGVVLFFGKVSLELRNEDQGNIFFSPFSIQAAFSMVLAGSGGVTHEEMSKVLHVMTKNPGDVHDQFRDLLKTIEVFVQDGAKIQEEYLSRVKENYLSAVENTDFSDDANRAKINAWVEDQTKNNIKDLLPPGSLNAMTRIVLVNAIYFKGNWLNQFDPARTRNQPFFQTKEKTIDVPMMSRKGHYRLIDIDALNARILELPYKGESMSMFLLVPREVDGLEALESALTHEMLEKVISTKGARRELTVVLPKFKLEYSFTLSKTLSKLGMPSAFNADEADFSGITGDKSLFVSEGYHKAFLEVNEEGSEAAAATGYPLECGGAFVEIEEVRVDRPFLFFIKDGPLGVVLFFGKVSS
ncbi:unnamed protein product, partial [Notodromas monacha]